jgi:hypothetical protein
MLRDEQEQKKLVFGQQVLDSLRGLHGEGNWLVERALDLGLVTVDPLWTSEISSRGNSGATAPFEAGMEC